MIDGHCMEIGVPSFREGLLKVNGGYSVLTAVIRSGLSATVCEHWPLFTIPT